MLMYYPNFNRGQSGRVAWFFRFINLCLPTHERLIGQQQIYSTLPIRVFFNNLKSYSLEGNSSFRGAEGSWQTLSGCCHFCDVCQEVYASQLALLNLQYHLRTLTTMIYRSLSLVTGSDEPFCAIIFGFISLRT